MPTSTPPPTKADLQQLKSVRDDLCNRFRENDKCLELARVSHNSAGVSRSTRVCTKLTKQITVLNLTIAYLENQA